MGFSRYSYRPFPHPGRARHPMAAIPSAVVSAAGSLQALRREIDSIDESLHDLLMRRAEAVTEVAKAKAREGGTDAPLFRPGREAEILRRLVARTRAPLPPELIVRIWRDIMVEFTRLQGPFAVAVAPGRIAEAARTHFGGIVLRPMRSIAAVISAVAKRRTQLGVLPLPGPRRGAAGWWPRLPAGVQILARLPFLRGAAAGDVEAVVIGRQPFEQSGDDVFYVAVGWTKRAGRPVALPPAALLKGGRMVAEARRGGRTLMLIETESVPAEAEGVDVLGGYARPIALADASPKRSPSKARR